MHTDWKPGPLPQGTWNWGGVVLVGQEAYGFYFADFCGDSVKIVAPGNPLDGKQIPGREIALYANCLELPPKCKGRAGA